MLKLQAEISALGSIPIVVGPRKGSIQSSAKSGGGGVSVTAQFTFETSRSTHFDAVLFAGGEGDAYVRQLATSGRLIHAAREAFMHYKTIGAYGLAADWLRNVALPGEIGQGAQGEGDGEVGSAGGIVLSEGEGEGEAVVSSFAEKFLGEVAKHRAWERDVSRIAA